MGAPPPSPPPPPAPSGGSYNPQIVAAVLALIGVMFTATIANWDKLFGGKPALVAPAQPADGPKAAAGGATPADASEAPRPVHAPANDEPVDPPTSPASTPPAVAGLWGDDDGYGFRIRQSGNAIHYATTYRGKPVGNGEGTITGRMLDYSFVNTTDSDSGRCKGQLSPDGQTISGRCTSDSGEGWPFTITR